MKKNLFYFAAPVFIATVLLFSCTAQTPKASFKKGPDGLIDSVSYAFGISQTEGFTEYLFSQGVDSAYVKHFLRGLIEGLNIDKNDKAAAAHLIGLQIGKNIGSVDIKQLTSSILVGEEDSLKILSKNNVNAGFIDGIAKKKTWITSLEARAYVEKVKNDYEDRAKDKNRTWLDENKTKEGVITTESGLQYKVIKKGDGKTPVATDKVKVDYVGTLINGTEFDSSVKHGGGPAEFPLNSVIKGWTEGIQLMPVGSEYEFYIPSELGYGDKGTGSIPAGATLIFKVTLHEIVTGADASKK
ncbi:MAG: FKBP-type peptidyl-prolyl cis-trans isomerase [Dysgonamonadaceae bacterium]|jgi:FKBP-type peptidyl-prolyl cis-trans isomerase FklB|nr:FKBP-type peptidyl-prolyl cis-trans isomerase [Dysgonamonadaceae bacterium]